MTRIAAIALLTLRGAVRSRMVLLLLGLLVMTVAGLPLTIKGDETVVGEVQILVNYTLGLAMLILSVATLWAGCATVSLEWQRQQLQLVLTKPVHPLLLWLGKWLGLVLLNAVLLLACAGITAGLLRWRLRESLADPVRRAILDSEILIARRPLRAQPVSVEAETAQRLREELARGTVPTNEAPEFVRHAIRRSLLTRAFSVPPGGRRVWAYPHPGPLAKGTDVLLRFRFSSSTLDLQPVRGLWTIRRGDQPPAFQQTTEAPSMAWHTLRVPAAPLQGEGPLVVEYANIHSTPVTVVFSPEEGLEVLARAGRFGPNYLRAILVLFGRLVLVSAFGITAGSLFSMPVAAFVSGFLLFLLQIAGYLQTQAAQAVVLPARSGGARLGARISQGLFALLHAVVRPLQTPDALDQLALGKLVAWGQVARVALIQGVCYPLLLALLAAAIMRRREPGLAE